MKECLNCTKKFQEKKETAKFCSTSCRVMWNRKHGKKKEQITKGQLQVVYNAILDLLSDPKLKKAAEAANNNLTTYGQSVVHYPSLQTGASIQEIKNNAKPFIQYKNEKRELESEEQYAAWLLAVDNDPFLSSKEKNLLKTIA